MAIFRIAWQSDPTNSPYKTRGDADNNGDNKNSNSSDVFESLYYNFSCPWEMDKYSCVQQGQTEKAEASRRWLMQNRQVIVDTLLPSSGNVLPAGTRLILTGDSTVRQIFISLACLLHSFGHRPDVHLQWANHWPCFSKRHCVSGGPHSGFDLSSILLTNGAEIHFLPHGGAPTIKGDFYKHMYHRMKTEAPRTNGHPELWMEDGSFTDANDGASSIPFSRRSNTLGRGDVIVASVGLHHPPTRHEELCHDLVDLAKTLQGTSDTDAAQLWYLSTPAQHFPTRNGQYVKKAQRAKRCRNSTDTNPRLVIEQKVFAEAPFIRFLDYDDLDLGYFHIGLGIDCSHYCMPGPPDRVAVRLLRQLQDTST